MKRGSTALLIALLFLSDLVSRGAEAQTPPRKVNVLFIVADDLNNRLGCYGDPLAKTPNVDRLAKRGVRFDRAYCQYPLCNPSRTSFLSGRRPETTRIFDNSTPPQTYLKDAPFLPQHFRRQGYFTGRADKIFHLGQGGQPNMDVPGGWEAVEEVAATHYPEKQRLREHVTRQGKLWAELDLADEKTGDGRVARWVAERIEQAHKDGKPFFLAAGFRKPHAQYVAPKRYFGLYKPEQIALPKEPPEHLAAIPRPALTRDDILSEEEKRQAKLAYYAGISFMDAQVGVLLDTLDRLKLWDSTVVVFIGDHGYHLGEHGGLWHKMTLFEEAARVPLVIAAPTVQGGVCRRTVELLDLYPTLADLCGLPKPDGLEGKSLVPLLKNPEAPWDRPAYTMVQRQNVTGRSVRTERYRYTEWDEGRRGAELYDHDIDPQEYRNLAADPQHAPTVEKMKRLLRRAPEKTETFR